MKRPIFCALAPLLICGCCCNRPKQPAEPDKLNPPTMAMSAVANAINANNQRIPTLWAALNYSATIVDNGQSHSVSSDNGVLLYQRPAGFRLVGEKEFIGRVFDIGSNDAEYWLEVIPGTNRMWWGRYADLARLKSDRLPIPIRPDLVLEVLGVSVIDTNFNALPAPTMRYNNAADMYVFVFNAKAPDRWIAVKEIWYDRTTLRPRRVILYDADGRPVLQARLSMDTRVQVPDDDNPNNWPLMAGEYKLFFPDSGSRMEFTLRDVRLYKKGAGRIRIPNAASFRLPDVQGTDVRAMQIGAGGGE